MNKKLLSISLLLLLVPLFNSQELRAQSSKGDNTVARIVEAEGDQIINKLRKENKAINAILFTDNNWLKKSSEEAVNAFIKNINEKKPKFNSSISFETSYKKSIDQLRKEQKDILQDKENENVFNKNDSLLAPLFVSLCEELYHKTVLEYQNKNLDYQNKELLCEKSGVKKLKKELEEEKKKAEKNTELQKQLVAARDSLIKSEENLIVTKETVESQIKSIEENQKKIEDSAFSKARIEQFLNKLSTLPQTYNKKLSEIEKKDLEKKYYETLGVYNTFLSPSQQERYSAQKDSIVNIFLVKTYYDKAITLLAVPLKTNEYKELEKASRSLKYYSTHTPVPLVQKEELENISILLEKYTESQEDFNKKIENILKEEAEERPSSTIGKTKKKEKLNALLSDLSFDSEYKYLNELVKKAKEAIDKDPNDACALERLKIDLPSK